MNATPLLQSLPRILFVMSFFVVLNFMITLRGYLKSKPRMSEPASGNIQKLQIGTETVFVTNTEYRSVMRKVYVFFLLAGLGMISIVLHAAIARAAF